MDEDIAGGCPPSPIAGDDGHLCRRPAPFVFPLLLIACSAGAWAHQLRRAGVAAEAVEVVEGWSDGQRRLLALMLVSASLDSGADLMHAETGSHC